MGWDVNSGDDNGWNLIARYVAVSSDLHFFAFFSVFFLAFIRFSCLYY
jgi:hypothetical protein